MSISKNKSRSGPTLSTNRRADEIYKTAQQAASGPVPTSVTGAQGFYGGATAAGQRGIDALSGNAGAQQQFMNPYQTQVIDNLNAQFGVQNQNTMNQVNDAATNARAFGGSRHGIATGVALGENARNQAGLLAQTYQQGFDNSMNRAGQVAGLGFNAAGAGSDLGMQAGNQNLWRLNTLSRGFNPMQMGASSGFGYSSAR